MPTIGRGGKRTTERRTVERGIGDMSNLDTLIDGAMRRQASPAGVSEHCRSTLAHLSRHRWLTKGEKRRHPKLADHDWIVGSLRFSGYAAAGDDVEAPVHVVIDVGQAFVIREGKLWVLSTGTDFTPESLRQAARLGWFGFTLLYDEREDIDESAT